MSTDGEKKTLIFHNPCRTIEEFRPVADMVARLKDKGEVNVIISAQHAVPLHEMPEGGSGWHEYAITSPGLHRFFPHELLKPHVNMDYANKNRELFIAKAEYLDKLGLKAAWWGVEPHFFPLSFFEEYPHLRGPRCDHPRRGIREEFSICPDHPESQKIISDMVKELREATPNLGAFIFKTNDAGATLCWANATYDGPNGPDSCRHLSPGQHLANYVNAVNDGLKRGGGGTRVTVGHSNFWGNEIFDHQRCLPENALLTGLLDKSSMGIGTCNGNPIRGMIDPLGIIGSTASWNNPEKKQIFFDFRAAYDRGNETPETVGKVFDIVEYVIANPVPTRFSKYERLREIAVRWGGEKNADKLFDALNELHVALRDKHIIASMFSPMYCAGSCRHLTRPLVFKPDLLTPEEEEFFLPYVFNNYISEARNDFIDLHGSRMSGVAGGKFASSQLDGLLGRIRKIARTIGSIEDAPESEWLGKLSTSIMVYYHVMRSIKNFYFGQKIRDEHKEEAERENYVPDKGNSFDGEGNILRWKELLRDEYDNIAELIKLFDERGLEQFAHVTDPKEQDSMSFPAHIVDDLRKKLKVMRTHWLDVEKYLASPMK